VLFVFTEFHPLKLLSVSGNGHLLTWGKGGPWLGYDCPSKEPSPRLVSGLDDVKVVQVSCGLKHTLGNKNYLNIQHISVDKIRVGRRETFQTSKR